MPHDDDKSGMEAAKDQNRSSLAEKRERMKERNNLCNTEKEETVGGTWIEDASRKG